MNLDSSAGDIGATPTTVLEDRLNLALRLAASQASSLVGGGASLIFTIPNDRAGASPRLRAAAGFASPDDARKAAQQADALVRGTMLSNRVETGRGLDASPSDASSLALPLVAFERCAGVLVLGHSGALNDERLQALETLAWATAVQLETPAVQGELEKLRSESKENLSLADDKSDELLKLSEELFAQDIELLRNNEKLGKIEKLKNDFIEKMSRELRTPLNSIIEATITVLASENDNLSSDSQRTLRMALDEGTAFQRTLENILDLWRIKQNELPIETQEFSFAELIDETIFSVGDTLGDKPVEILKDIPEPLPKIRGDLTKINKILFLLLDNAAKFIERGTITIGARIANDRLHCSIEDTGIGICADDQKYIWNEFYQVDDRGSNKYRGAGLGLTLVHDLLALLQGDSSLKSEPGQGTRVEFSVPATLA